MTTALAIAVAAEERGHRGFTPQEVELLRRNHLPADATDDEVALFVAQATRLGLDPFARQIYATRTYDPRTGRDVLSIRSTIDGFRIVAERSGRYLGQSPPQWCGSDGKWVDVWLKKTAPAAARVGVYREGAAEPTVCVATFRSYARRGRGGELDGPWVTMPDVMLSKCAEALALRKAFPALLSGIYTGDEMAQAGEAPERAAAGKEGGSRAAGAPKSAAASKQADRGAAAIEAANALAAELTERIEAATTLDELREVERDATTKRAQLGKTRWAILAAVHATRRRQLSQAAAQAEADEAARKQADLAAAAAEGPQATPDADAVHVPGSAAGHTLCGLAAADVRVDATAATCPVCRYHQAALAGGRA